MKDPKDGSAVIATLKRDEEVVFLGHEEGAFVKVLAPVGEGWVRKLVVMK